MFSIAFECGITAQNHVQPLNVLPKKPRVVACCRSCPARAIVTWKSRSHILQKYPKVKRKRQCVVQGHAFGSGEGQAVAAAGLLNSAAQ